mmetsp:Transcript_22403/g.55485  ORF Transcript_22403/g.55485 Transcript_22403/m.55485 type:complete len:85 (-) Transcript_22403:1339-1593(-)
MGFFLFSKTQRVGNHFSNAKKLSYSIITRCVLRARALVYTPASTQTLVAFTLTPDEGCFFGAATCSGWDLCSSGGGGKIPKISS